MIHEIAMLLEQRDVCRRFADLAADTVTKEQFLRIADQYEVKATSARAKQSAWDVI